jgi:hypothetical protein
MPSMPGDTPSPVLLTTPAWLALLLILALLAAALGAWLAALRTRAHEYRSHTLEV